MSTISIADSLYKFTSAYKDKTFGSRFIKRYIFKGKEKDPDNESGSFNFIPNILYDENHEPIQDIQEYFSYSTTNGRFLNKNIRVCNIPLDILQVNSNTILAQLSRSDKISSLIDSSKINLNNVDILQNVYGVQFTPIEFYGITNIMISMYKITRSKYNIKIGESNNSYNLFNETKFSQFDEVNKTRMKISVMSSNFLDISFNDYNDDAEYYVLEVTNMIEYIGRNFATNFDNNEICYVSENGVDFRMSGVPENYSETFRFNTKYCKPASSKVLSIDNEYASVPEKINISIDLDNDSQIINCDGVISKSQLHIYMNNLILDRKYYEVKNNTLKFNIPSEFVKFEYDTENIKASVKFKLFIFDNNKNDISEPTINDILNLSGENKVNEPSDKSQLINYYPQYYKHQLEKQANNAITIIDIDRIHRSEICRYFGNDGERLCAVLEIPYKHSSIMVFKNGLLITPIYFRVGGHDSPTYPKLNTSDGYEYIYIDIESLASKDEIDKFSSYLLDELILSSPISVVISETPFIENAYTYLTEVPKYYKETDVIIQNGYVIDGKLKLKIIDNEKYSRSLDKISDTIGRYAYHLDENGEYIKTYSNILISDSNKNLTEDNIKIFSEEIIVDTEKGLSISHVIHPVRNIKIRYEDISDIYYLNSDGTDLSDIKYESEFSKFNKRIVVEIMPSEESSEEIIDINNHGKLIAINTSSSYTEHFSNKVDENFLSYIVPNQIVANKNKVLTFLNGKLSDEFIINNNLFCKLFDGNTMLSFTDDPIDPDSIFSYEYDENGKYVYIDGEYVPFGDLTEFIVDTITPSKYLQDAGGTYKYIDYSDNFYIANPNGNYIKYNGRYVLAKSYPHISSLKYLKIGTLRSHNDIDNSSGDMLPKNCYIVLDGSVDSGEIYYDKSGESYIDSPKSSYEHIYVYNINSADLKYKLNKYNSDIRYSKQIASIYVSSLGNYSLYQDAHGISISNGIFTIDDSTCNFILSQTNAHISIPFSNKYMTIFINGRYINPKYIKEISNKRFALVEGALNDIFGEDNLNITNMYIYTYSNLNIDEFYEPYYLVTNELTDYLWDKYLSKSLLDGIERNVSINAEDVEYHNENSKAALLEIFGKYVLPYCNFDGNFELANEIKAYFRELYDNDGRMRFEYNIDSSKRKFIY